ncbi:MAG: DNA-directed RNA polymerase subunit beta', partial [Candidatus Enterenecus sp.]
DNGRRGRAVTGANNRALKSLSDFLKGKQGRFRQNLLGKRVDYSGRSVIVVGPELKIYQCGVPKEMAIELFRPFVMKKLVEDGHANNIKSAKKMVDKASPAVWDALEFVIKEHPVMLNRAPTLHRLGIQAFEPVLVEGRAMKLHPLVCTAFNADFDGDQMAIHVPLSAEAQAEARILMLAANNLLRPADGGPVTVPTQDMVLGSYYLTYERDPEHDPDRSYNTTAEAAQALADGTLFPNDRIWVRDESANRWYRTTPALCAEAVDGKAREVYSCFDGDIAARLAYDEGELDLHEPIMVRRYVEVDGEQRSRMVRTTVGRLIFNEGIPQDLGFVDRSDPEEMFEPEINFICGKKQLGKIIDKCIAKHGFTVSAGVLDTIKARGYKFSTRGSLTVAIADMTVPAQKAELIAATEKEVVKIENQYKRGFLTNDERYRLVVSAWEKTTADVSDALQKSMDRYNPIFMMADSGARGSQAQIRQLAGMRGLMADTSGRTIEIPIKSNFREGLSVLEYFISSRGARKGMADTALRTADSGYLTRRLVDVSQEVIIREEDCCTHDGITISEISENGQVIETLKERLRGRYLSEDFVDYRTGEVLVGRDHLVDTAEAEFIEKKLHEQAAAEGDPDRKVSIRVRSVLTCEARTGVCARCYGMNLAFGEPVGQGEAVGIIAAQSIGEPGTQLTMRTFHTGGVAGGDITQGLPRVEELFEARKPKKMAQLAEISGVVSLEEAKRSTLCNVTITADDGEVVTYAIPYSAGLRVKNGDTVTKGQELTDGALSPHDVLRVRGVDAVHNYLIQEVQKPYRQQGVDINDKHIEVIVRQMMRKVRVEEGGDSTLLSGSTVDIIEYKDACRAVEERIAAGEKNELGGELQMPTCTRILLGITKASLATESFLSAASFQETTKVLTEAAIKGKVDRLLGLKENVIIGKLIPAGSGLAAYRKYDEIEDEVHEEDRYDSVNAAAAAAKAEHEDFPEGPEADEPEEDEVLSVSLDEE